jgi:dihydroflavonol-4-reductase
MKRALVTGGCGFLGSWMVRQLIEEGVSVRVLALPGESRENVEDLDVEVLEGDVLETGDVRRAVAGVDTVFHAAAIYEDWAPDPTRMYDVNLRGTFHVLAAAREAKVERVIYTASIVSLGRSEGGRLADEQTPYEAWDIDFPYSRSKYFSRQIAECFSDFDLDVRVVCPGIVMGPGDLRPTPSGRLIINSFMPGPAPWFDGGASYVDVRDAARVHLLAASRGRPGERYLATAHNLSNLELARAVDRATGRQRRYLKLPVPLARAVIRGMEGQAARRGKRPLFSSVFVEYSLKPSYYDNAKARRELGADFRPIEETIRDAVDYFRARGRIR